VITGHDCRGDENGCEGCAEQPGSKLREYGLTERMRHSTRGDADKRRAENSGPTLPGGKGAVDGDKNRQGMGCHQNDQPAEQAGGHAQRQRLALKTE
jgi:hypothetical protein